MPELPSFPRTRPRLRSRIADIATPTPGWTQRPRRSSARPLLNLVLLLQVLTLSGLVAVLIR